jgi:hypothetical protein
VNLLHRGDSAILSAALNRDKDICEILMRAGADPRIPDSQGVAPLDEHICRGSDITWILLGFDPHQSPVESKERIF